jgi:hypothetical protein
VVIASPLPLLVHPPDPACIQVLLSEDVNGAANKLIALKAEFPKADVFAIFASRPKTLLQSEATLLENAKQVGFLVVYI